MYVCVYAYVIHTSYGLFYRALLQKRPVMFVYMYMLFIRE